MDTRSPSLEILPTIEPLWFQQSVAALTSKKRLWVGYSGGLDSHVLLHLAHEMCKKTPDYSLGAIHIHHGLSPHADTWVRHCEQVCTEWQIPLRVLWVDAQSMGDESPEEAAREARWGAWEEFLQSEECLMLAHHAEDQAETILLRLFRGAGPQGLGGMPALGTLGTGTFIRPLLSLSKESLIHYAKTQKLQWIEDESNQNLQFDRNYVRHEILPRITARWPRVVRSVGRAGSLCLETATAIQILAESDYRSVKLTPEGLFTFMEEFPDIDPNEILSVKALLKLDPVRRKGVLRHWLKILKLSMPSLDHMERIDREILCAKPDSKPRLKVGDYEIHRLKDVLLAVI